MFPLTDLMKKLFFIAVMLCCSALLSAEQKKDWGRVSASLESLNHVYVDDAANNFHPGQNSDLAYLRGSRFASNDYLKVDYYKGRLSAGLQVEGYFPTTIGYPIAESMLSVSNLYVGWTDDSYSVTAGTFYEQLGSGLLFRSWEDRALGLNNAILGARATYRYKDFLNVRVFGGLPRMGKVSTKVYNTGTGKIPVFSFGYTKTAVAAADAGLSLSECFGWDNLMMSVEGSFLYKYEDLPEDLIKYSAGDVKFRSHNLGWSGRFNLDYDGLYFRGEYVDAGVLGHKSGTAYRADAQLVEIGYNAGGLGVSVSGRRLWRMNQRIYMSDPAGFVETEYYNQSVNILSYCPALCTQYTYMLANLNPYTPLTDGEAGGQIDAFYNFRRGTKVGGKRGMKVHANFSTYFSLNDDGGFKGGELQFLDFSFDIEKQWTKKFKMNLMYALQDYRTRKQVTLSNGDKDALYVGMSHAFVADLLYKWTDRISTRLELQYLATDGFQKDWMAGLLELNFAPNWSIFASDMYNHGSTKMHYYNAGVSYAYKWIRVAAGYGRYRAGFICSGGVCREVPAYTGANLTLTATF